MSEELSAAVICPDYCTYPQVGTSRQLWNNQQGYLEYEVRVAAPGIMQKAAGLKSVVGI